MPEKMPSFINPAYEKNQAEKQARIRFQGEYRKPKEKMTFPGGEFEYIDIEPKEKTGKDTFIAVGTPWSWEQMEDFVFQLQQAGHRVTSLIHPDFDLKNGRAYQPEIQRPLALETFFQNAQLEDATVIAHSFGLIDTLRKGTAGIGRLIAINPAGLSDINPVKHSINALKSTLDTLSPDKHTPEETKANRLLVKTFLKQSLQKSIKEIIGAGSADMSEELEKFKEKIPVVIFRNIDDTLVPPKKAHDQSFRKFETGGNHLGPFVKHNQAQEIIRTIEEMEKENTSA